MRLIIGLLLAAQIALSATLVSKATGNFTAAGTWGVGEAGAGAIQTTRSANTDTTTSYVYSTAFTCTNLDVVDGIMVYGRRLNTTGTVSVALSEDNGTTATRELAINASDMDDDDSFHFFKFASTLTCDGGTDYKVGIKGSSAANATFYRDGTAGNWFRVPRITTTAAPGAADLLYITGDLTGAGTGNSFTVTMDSTAATVFGATTATESIGVGVRGTLSYGVTAATAYRLNIAGVARVVGGGAWNQGTSGTRMPSTASGRLIFDLVANVDSGFECLAGGACGFYGVQKTRTCYLEADEAAAQTVIGPLSASCTTGWAATDEIGFSSTTRTVAQWEKKVISTVDSATQITLTAGLTNAHDGHATDVPRAEVINTDSNVTIEGESASLQGYVQISPAATFNADNLEFFQLGSGASPKWGVEVLVGVTTGTCNITDSSFKEFKVSGSQGITVDTNATCTVLRSVFYDMASAALVNRDQAILSVTDSTVIGCSNFCVYIEEPNQLTLSGVNVSGSTTDGIFFNGGATDPVITFTPNVHSNAAEGIDIPSGIDIKRGTFGGTGFKSWMNNSFGFRVNTGTLCYGYTIEGLEAFGNIGSNIQFACTMYDLTMRGLTLNGFTGASTDSGIQSGSASSWVNARLENSTIGVASGDKLTHAVQDINWSDGGYYPIGSKVTLGSTTQISIGSLAANGSFLAVSNYGGTDGDHRWFSKFGTRRTDTVTFKTASPSIRLTPNNFTTKLISDDIKVVVEDGGTVTFNIYVRKSVAGDSCGAEYTGAAQPRLISRRNYGLGITSDTVLDTMTLAVGNWEQLTGSIGPVSDAGVLAFYVDGVGTAGCFYIDDITVSGASTSANTINKFYDGLFSPGGVGASGGGASAYTFIQ